MAFDILKAWSTLKDKPENIRASRNSLKVISVEHERAHAGRLWYNNDEYVVPPSTINYYLFKVNSLTGNNEMHLQNYSFVSDQGPMKLHLREDPSVDVNSLGTVLSLENMNRNNRSEAPGTLYGDPSIDVNSLGLHMGYILQPASAPGNQPAGGLGAEDVAEWILDNNRYYLFSVENTSVNSATLESQILIYSTEG